MPRLTRLTAREIRIPLTRTVRHASHARDENRSLLVEAELDDGTVGYGEGLPRAYVTGESIDSVFATLADADLPRQFGGSWDGLPEAIALCDAFTPPPPPERDFAGHPPRDSFGNTARCAVELAVLDAACRTAGRPLSDVTRLAAPDLFAPHDRVRYGVVLTTVSAAKQRALSLAYRAYGFRDLKVKVGGGRDDAATLARVRRWAGSSMDLRADANEGWPADELEARVAPLRRFGLTALEQPVPHAAVGRLADLKPRLGVPVMLDESLCSMGDAVRAADDGLCDLLNLRLSKCGGFLPCLRLAAFAADRGIGVQLGCMVGETGVLSAAGRHFARSLPQGGVTGLRFVEGSFDRHLVREPLTREDLTFGRGGFAPALPGPGLGVTVDRDAVERVTVRREDWRCG